MGGGGQTHDRVLEGFAERFAAGDATEQEMKDAISHHTDMTGASGVGGRHNILTRHGVPDELDEQRTIKLEQAKQILKDNGFDPEDPSLSHIQNPADATKHIEDTSPRHSGSAVDDLTDYTSKHPDSTSEPENVNPLAGLGEILSGRKETEGAPAETGTPDTPEETDTPVETETPEVTDTPAEEGEPASAVNAFADFTGLGSTPEKIEEDTPEGTEQVEPYFYDPDKEAERLPDTSNVTGTEGNSNPFKDWGGLGDFAPKTPQDVEASRKWESLSQAEKDAILSAPSEEEGDEEDGEAGGTPDPVEPEPETPSTGAADEVPQVSDEVEEVPEASDEVEATPELTPEGKRLKYLETRERNKTITPKQRTELEGKRLQGKLNMDDTPKEEDIHPEELEGSGYSQDDILENKSIVAEALRSGKDMSEWTKDQHDAHNVLETSYGENWDKVRQGMVTSAEDHIKSQQEAQDMFTEDDELPPDKNHLEQQLQETENTIRDGYKFRDNITAMDTHHVEALNGYHDLLEQLGLGHEHEDRLANLQKDGKAQRQEELEQQKESDEESTPEQSTPESEEFPPPESAGRWDSTKRRDIRAETLGEPPSDDGEAPEIGEEPMDSYQGSFSGRRRDSQLTFPYGKGFHAHVANAIKEPPISQLTGTNKSWNDTKTLGEWEDNVRTIMGEDYFKERESATNSELANHKEVARNAFAEGKMEEQGLFTSMSPEQLQSVQAVRQHYGQLNDPDAFTNMVTAWKKGDDVPEEEVASVESPVPWNDATFRRDFFQKLHDYNRETVGLPNDHPNQQGLRQAMYTQFQRGARYDWEKRGSETERQFSLDDALEEVRTKKEAAEQESKETEERETAQAEMERLALEDEEKRLTEQKETEEREAAEAIQKKRTSLVNDHGHDQEYVDALTDKEVESTHKTELGNRSKENSKLLRANITEARQVAKFKTTHGYSDETHPEVGQIKTLEGIKAFHAEETARTKANKAATVKQQQVNAQVRRIKEAHGYDQLPHKTDHLTTVEGINAYHANQLARNKVKADEDRETRRTENAEKSKVQAAQDYLKANGHNTDESKKITNMEGAKAYHSKSLDSRERARIYRSLGRLTGKSDSELVEEYRNHSTAEMKKAHTDIQKNYAAADRAQKEARYEGEALNLTELPEGAGKNAKLHQLRKIAKLFNENLRHSKETGSKGLLTPKAQQHLNGLAEGLIKQVTPEDLEKVMNESKSMGEDFMESSHLADLQEQYDSDSLHEADHSDMTTGEGGHGERVQGFNHSKAHELHHYEEDEDGQLKRTGATHTTRDDKGKIVSGGSKTGGPSSEAEAEGHAEEANHPPKVLGLSHDDKIKQNRHFELLKKAMSTEGLTDEEKSEALDIEDDVSQLGDLSYKAHALGALRSQATGDAGKAVLERLGFGGPQSQEDQDEAMMSSCKPPMGSFEVGKAWNPATHRWCDEEYLKKIQGTIKPGEGMYFPNGLHHGTENAHLDKDADGNTQAVLATQTGVHKVNPPTGEINNHENLGHRGAADVAGDTLGSHLADHEGGKVDESTLDPTGINQSMHGPGGKKQASKGPAAIRQDNIDSLGGGTGMERQQNRRGNAKASPLEKFLERSRGRGETADAGEGLTPKQYVGESLRDVGGALPSVFGGGLIRGTSAWKKDQLKNFTNNELKTQSAAQKFYNSVHGNDEE